MSSPRLPSTSSGAASAAILVPLLFSAIVYRPLLGVYFRADDFLSLYRIANGNLLEYILSPHGGHLLFTRNAIFYAFFEAFGAHAEPYYAAVLTTHLLNVGLLFAVLRRWTESPLLAAFGATLWGTCPVQAEALGWYSVYGQVVVATILLLLLWQSTSFVQGSPVKRAPQWLWPLLLLMASSSFGTGLAVALVFPFTTFLLLPSSPARRRLCAILAIFAAALPFLYRGAIGLHETLYGRPYDADVADFVLSHFDLAHSALMVAQLFGYGVIRPLLGFAYDPPFLSAHVLYASLVAFALFFLGALRLSSSALRRKLFALLILALGCYAIVAAGRAVFFAPAGMPRAAATPRYHYIATLPLVAILCIGLRGVYGALRPPGAARAALFALWLVFEAISFQRAQPFINPHKAARNEVSQVRAAVTDAVARGTPGSTVYIQNRPFRSIGPLLFKDETLFPGWAGAFVFLYPSNVVSGHRVRFIEDDRATRDAARTGQRSADLLVSPAEAAASS